MGLPPGSKFGPFTILEHLPGGGMAEVYRANETITNREVAVKILTTDLIHKPGYQQRFLHEAQILAKLQHSHIVPLYTANIENGVPWMAMEFARGGSLSDAIKAGQLARERSLTILVAVAEALDFAHSQPDPILHRDVKPANILLRADGHVYLADFGLAKIAQATPGFTASGMVIGTVEYMSPEQTKGAQLDHRCDIYALGVVAYQLIVGRIPFDSVESDLLKRYQEIVEKHQLRPMPEDDVPSHARTILRKCLAKQAGDRYASASEFVLALQEALTETVTIVRPITPAVPAQSERRSGQDGYDPDPLDGTERYDSRLLRRDVNLVHLTDINIPMGNSTVSWLWHRRWRAIAAKIDRQQPDVLVVTGKLFQSRGFRPSAWQRFMTDVKRRFPKVILVFAPSADERAFIEELTREQQDAPYVIVPEDPALKTGWRDLIEQTLHLYNVSSNQQAWFGPAVTDLELQRCETVQHLHIAVVHRYVRPESNGQGNDDDADDRLNQLAKLGFDLVLYGQRQGNKKTYVDPLPQRQQGLWLVPAPSRPPLSGFNLIVGRTDGSFEVHTFRRERTVWRPQTIINEEEGRMRQWRAQHRTGSGCDTLEVHIELYAPEKPKEPSKPAEQKATEQKAAAHLRCGDLSVKMTLHHPLLRHDRLPIPLQSVVGYKATEWRALKAVAINPNGLPSDLPIDADGPTIKVTPFDRRKIEISAVVLNAVPTAIGDWSRMQASQPDLQELFRFQTTIAARFLRAHIKCPHLHPLVPGRQESRTAETEFLTVQSDKKGDEVTLFRPVIGASYGLAFKVDDPVDESVGLVADDIVPATPSEDDVRDPLEWQRVVANLLNMPGTNTYHTIQNALDTLRSQFIEIIRPAAPERSTKDITVDLLGVGGQLRVVMNDSKQELHKVAPPSLGLMFAWGQGIAGRALRLTQEYRWSQRKYPKDSPEAMWPADEWYYKHPDMKRHAHVYCRPIAIRDEQGRPYVIAIVSFATHENKSSLRDLIRALRSRDKSIEAQCDAAFTRFTTTLLEELA